MLIDPSHGQGKLVYHLKENVKRVLIVFFHGLGDTILFQAPFRKLKEDYPNIHFDLGLARGLDQEALFPDSVLLDGDWREKSDTLGYDIVFACNFPLEDIKNPNKTKAEICCEEELGIVPVSGHPILQPKKMVAVSFQMTSIPWVSNAEEEVAKQVWQDIVDAGFIPCECLMTHVFHNPENKKYDFIDKSIRTWPAKLETLAAFMGSCHAFVGVVSGNFHLALSVLPPQRVMLLERELRVGHFTKMGLATANLKNYKNEVKKWLETL